MTGQRFAPTVVWLRKTNPRLWTTAATGMLHSHCRSGTVPGLEGYQAQDREGCGNWRPGQRGYRNLVLHPDVCRWHWHGNRLICENLVLPLAAHSLRLPLQRRPVLPLEGGAVSCLCPMYRRTSGNSRGVCDIFLVADSAAALSGPDGSHGGGWLLPDAHRL